MNTIRTDRVNRWNRRQYFLRTVIRSLASGVNPISYFRLLLPLRIRKPGSLPHAVYIELADSCNVACNYCPYSDHAGATGFIGMNVIERLADILHGTPVDKINLGGGEPTLHPHFVDCARLLRTGARFLNVVTNGQWVRDETAEILASGLFDMVEISIDAGGSDEYESARIGADFGRLVDNLAALNRLRSERRSHTIIAVRLMVRPSTAALEPASRHRWRRICDTLITQRVVQQAADFPRDDVYLSSTAARDAYPRCTYIFRAMQVRRDGSVPLCCINGRAGVGETLTLGNVLQRGIGELWLHPVLEKYREAHRLRIEADMPVCRSCTGA